MNNNKMVLVNCKKCKALLKKNEGYDITPEDNIIVSIEQRSFLCEDCYDDYTWTVALPMAMR